MPTVKEYREFFLRAVKTTSGAKPDQELNYPVSYSSNGVTKLNRFLKDHFPSEGVFKKLFESLPFKLNKEDTAKTNSHGLVKVASDTKAYDRLSNGSTDFTAVVVPHQLPELLIALDGTDTIDTVNIGNGITITTAIRDIGGLISKVFMITVDKVAHIYLNQTFTKSSSVTLSVVTGNGGQLLEASLKTSLAYEFEAYLFISTNSTANIKVRMGGTAVATVISYSVTGFADATSVSLSDHAIVSDLGVTSKILTGWATNKGVVIIRGSIVVSNAGTLQVEAAQGTLDASNADVLIGSTFRVTEVTKS